MLTPETLPTLTCWQMSDGYEIRGRFWPAPQPADVAILYLHGIQSHGGWYEGSAAHLAAGGLPVMMPDRRGSGLNEAARGDTPGAQRWFDDVAAHCEWLRGATGARRLALVGVSWGGKLAAAFALRRPAELYALLLIAPGIFPAVTLAVTRRVHVGWSLLSRDPTRQFAIPLHDPRLFTANPAGQKFIAADPLKLTHVTARFLYESARVDRALARAASASLAPATTLLLAGDDRIIRNDATERGLRRIAARPATVHTFPAAGHTLEFEADSAQFLATIRAWQRRICHNS
ncbi:MAG: alpha/beta fold hydrolase [Phycisphaerae bacterium]